MKPGLFVFSVAGVVAAASVIAQQAVPQPDLGVGVRLHGRAVFPAGDPWNQDISRDPVDADSVALIASIGANKGLHGDFGTTYGGVPNGIPYVVVDSGPTPGAAVTFEYKNESDPGPYPLPADAPVEGGNEGKGDRHVLVVDRAKWRLYELFDAHRQPDGKSWRAGSGAVFDLTSGALRPAGWTSADAAGLPIFPGLVRYEEAVETGAIRHALRFTCTRTRRAYVAPARHFASTNTDPHLPPMGMRVRLQADFDVEPFPPAARVILTALKTYGMILADNGSDWFISGAPDPRWDDDAIGTLRRVKGSDFEVVKMGPATTR